MKKTLFSALALVALMASPSIAADYGIAGLALGSASGTLGGTFALGAQTGGGISGGKTEIAAHSLSNLTIGANGIAGTLAVSTLSDSFSGSAVNGNGSAYNVTGGGALALTALGAAGGYDIN